MNQKKSAILEAIAKTNYLEDNNDFKFSKILDYSRSEFVKVSNENPETVTYFYMLDEDDIKTVVSALID